MRNLKKIKLNIFLFFLIAILFSSCKAQINHTDLMEYGYFGKVKLIKKSTFDISKNDKIDSNSTAAKVDTYFINDLGNIDSLTLEMNLINDDSYFHKTIFDFKNLKRKGWCTFSITNDTLMRGTINWETDNQFKETFFYPNGKVQLENNQYLNAQYRTYKLNSKSYDEFGELNQSITQEFKFSSLGDIDSVITTNLLFNLKSTKNYNYLKKDASGNPLELIITSKPENTKSLIKIEYQYFN